MKFRQAYKPAPEYGVHMTRCWRCASTDLAPYGAAHLTCRACDAVSRILGDGATLSAYEPAKLHEVTA